MAKKETRNIALMFKALGEPTRLRIFQYLWSRCAPVVVEDGNSEWMAVGPTVSEVCDAVSSSKKITAKISHHLKEMRLAGLISIERRGKNMICGVNRDAIDQLSGFLNMLELQGTSDSKSPTEIAEDIPLLLAS